MRRFLKILTHLSATLSLISLFRPRDVTTSVFLWVPKLLGGALSPILGIIGGLGALVGFVRRDWGLTGAGILAAGSAAKFMQDIPDARAGMEAAFGSDWQARVPVSLQDRMLPKRWSLRAGPPAGALLQQNITYGHNGTTSEALLADLWEPQSCTPRTGMGLIFVHGGGWVIGAKDLGTRPFLQRLAGQGHVVLDINYTLWPQADIPTMVAEINQAIQWMKTNSQLLGIDPEHLVLMGGSAGGHLALLTAYTADHPAFGSSQPDADTSVCGVVAFYPPTDFVEWDIQGETSRRTPPNVFDRAADAMMARLFLLHHQNQDGTDAHRSVGLLTNVLGGRHEDIPDTYRLMSPISHVGPHCPPTLLLQGNDDVFRMPPGVRRLHSLLQETGVPTILVEFPHAEHAFDLVFPLLSPLAQAATYDVERFLAMLV